MRTDWTRMGPCLPFPKCSRRGRGGRGTTSKQRGWGGAREQYEQFTGNCGICALVRVRVCVRQARLARAAVAASLQLVRAGKARAARGAAGARRRLVTAAVDAAGSVARALDSCRRAFAGTLAGGGLALLASGEAGRLASAPVRWAGRWAIRAAGGVRAAADVAVRVCGAALGGESMEHHLRALDQRLAQLG
jgi:hypothetical protein